MSDGVFQAYYGKQTFGNITESVALFGINCPTEKQQTVSWDEKQIGNKVFPKLGTAHRLAASTDGFKDHGGWMSTSYQAPEGGGKILVVQYTRRVSGAVQSCCCMNLLPSPAANHMRLEIDLAPNQLSALNNRLIAFEGKAFVIAPDELKVMGVRVKRGDRSYYMDEEELEDEFRIVASGSTSMDYLEVDRGDGDVRAIPTASAPSRRMRVRRN